MITRRTVNPKKRGPKTTKIAECWDKIPLEITKLEDVAALVGVSVNVLKQHGRFNKSGHKIIVKQKNGVRHIQRVAAL